MERATEKQREESGRAMEGSGSQEHKTISAVVLPLMYLEGS